MRLISWIHPCGVWPRKFRNCLPSSRIILTPGKGLRVSLGGVTLRIPSRFLLREIPEL
jgi:hypothetical protein